jgi:hypothetical protein
MTTLTNLATALAVLGERELLGLRAALDGSPNFAPGLLAWLEHAVGWEIDRRKGGSTSYWVRTRPSTTLRSTAA